MTGGIAQAMGPPPAPVGGDGLASGRRSRDAAFGCRLHELHRSLPGLRHAVCGAAAVAVVRVRNLVSGGRDGVCQLASLDSALEVHQSLVIVAVSVAAAGVADHRPADDDDHHDVDHDVDHHDDLDNDNDDHPAGRDDERARRRPRRAEQHDHDDHDDHDNDDADPAARVGLLLPAHEPPHRGGRIANAGNVTASQVQVLATLTPVAAGGTKTTTSGPPPR